MLAGRFTQQTLRLLDWLAATILPPEDIPEHQRVGKRGEEDAYFYLRRLGYIIIARNFRSPIIAENWIWSDGMETFYVLLK